ncbi:MAG: cupredoxin domain-containing protein [Rhodocyclaceae bacterium]|nr:cupredoxin domain-containing protein [Rhodocyclaceae bacterium]
MSTTKPTSTSSLLLALLLCGAMSAAWGDELPTFEVVARDGRLLPERLEVPAGTRIKLALKNAGRSPVEFEDLDLRVEKVLAPGASSFVVIHSLQPGSYKFVDEFHAATAQLLLIAK